MLYSFFVAILLPTIVLAFKCMPSNFKAEYSLKNFNLRNFEKSVKSLKPSNRGDYCELQVVIQHLERSLTVRSINNSVKLDPEYKAGLWFSTKINLNQNPNRLESIFIERHFTIRCETEDWCDVSLLFRFLDVLLKENYDQTVEMALPLFFQSYGESEVCNFYESNPVYCGGSACAVRYSDNKRNYSISCPDDSDKDTRFEYNTNFYYFLAGKMNDENLNEMSVYMFREPEIFAVYICEVSSCGTDEKTRAFIETFYNAHQSYVQMLPTMMAPIMTKTPRQTDKPLTLKGSLLNLVPMPNNKISPSSA